MTNKVGFFKRLKGLSSSQKQLFAVALCQRMYPNYQLFSEVSQFGDPQVLDTVLNLLWQSLYDQKLKFNIDIHLDRLNAVMPEPENFDIYGVYPAMDAVTGLIALLSAIQGKYEDDMINISKLSSSTVANYIETLCQNELSDIFDSDVMDDFIFAHEYMSHERELQASLLNMIEQESKISADLVKGLRKEIIDSGVSNIGIEVN